MLAPAHRSDDGADYVSMHHRIRKDLRRRLKHLAVDLDKPVTDIVNEAIVAYIDKIASKAVAPMNLSPAELLAELRHARAAGSFYETIAGVDKASLVEVSRLLGERADMRSSGDRLVSRIAAALSDPTAG